MPNNVVEAASVLGQAASKYAIFATYYAIFAKYARTDTIVMYTVAALVYPDALASSLTLPMEILTAASQTALGANRHARPLSFLLAGETHAPLSLASGLTLHLTAARDNLPPLDLLILPAIWRNPLPTLRACNGWLPELRRIAATGTRICSVGTASCILAEAGLLAGRPATTHWNWFERFARRYPDVQLKTRHLITQSENIYCVGSVNSIADLCVHVTEDWYGSRIAKAVEHQFSPEIRRPFRAAARQDPPRSSHHDETVLQAHSSGCRTDCTRRSPCRLSRRRWGSAIAPCTAVFAKPPA